MNGIEGKVAIVTGAATLIGKGVAEGFAEAGAKVVMVDIASPQVEAAAAEIGPNARFYLADITDDDAIDACIAFAKAEFGGVDFLVNLASTYLDNGVMTSREDWLASLNVNLVSSMVFSAKVAQAMSERGGGAIVNFASIAGKRAQPGRMTYSAAKAAILQASKNAAMQLQPQGVRVNTVSPGWTWSNIMRDLTGDDLEKTNTVAAPFHIMHRVGLPSEIAATVVFLCSDSASFITGTDIAVDGGYTAIGPEGFEDAVAKLAQ